MNSSIIAHQNECSDFKTLVKYKIEGIYRPCKSSMRKKIVLWIRNIAKFTIVKLMNARGNVQMQWSETDLRLNSLLITRMQSFCNSFFPAEKFFFLFLLFHPFAITFLVNRMQCSNKTTSISRLNDFQFYAFYIHTHNWTSLMIKWSNLFGLLENLVVFFFICFYQMKQIVTRTISRNNGHWFIMICIGITSCITVLFV